MKIGFTGTQEGMTNKQKGMLWEILALQNPTEFHHGDCIGADAFAHKIAKDLNIRVVGHPPASDVKRAFCRFDEVREPSYYLIRNQHIVDETDLLVATPRGYVEQLRSGTWATIRYARRRVQPIMIIWPDGTVKYENTSR